ncbi:MAG TPA: glycosyltransferase [Chitinophagaceae bacterium]|nr:glycosyltransferase [Chitinophagaceae bacterium]
MNIAVYVPPVSKKPTANFIVETFFPLLRQFPDHDYILITDVSSECGPMPGFEKITIRDQPKNPILKSFWIERTLSGLIKKIKADLFISADDFCSLSTSLPQCILMPASGNLGGAYAKKPELLIVTNELAKKELITKWKLRDDKIVIVYPSPGNKYSPLNADTCESVKAKYSGGKEYFLCIGSFPKQEKFIHLLKSFSHFKKRQQSSFKLLISGPQNSSLGKSLENYKYRNDVIIVNTGSIGEKAAITAAAYALVLAFNPDEDITYAFGAMQSAVPVITTRNSSISEIAGDAVLYSENEITAMGEKMMQLYKDELLKSQLIEKGYRLVKDFTVEKSASRLWQSMMKAMN